MRAYRADWRDRLVGASCNWMINTFASREYRAFIGVCYDLGQGRLERKLLGTDEDPWQDVGPRRKA